MSHAPTKTSYRPQAQIYSNLIPSIFETESYHANRIESDSLNRYLSIVYIEPIMTLNQHEINPINDIIEQVQQLSLPSYNYQHAMFIVSSDELIEQLNNEQILSYLEQDLKHQYATSRILTDEYMDTDYLQICQINEQPWIFNSLIQPFNEILLKNEEFYQVEVIKVI